jgi:hypothetical protein
VSKQKKTGIKVKIQDAYYKNRLKELVHFAATAIKCRYAKIYLGALPLENIRGMLLL